MIWTVCALYRFVSIPNAEEMRPVVKTFLSENGVCGTILLAHEGINGTIGAPDEATMEKVVAFLDQNFGVNQGEIKYSTASDKPFERMKVHFKREIVTMKAPEANPTQQVGTYVSAQQWNELISDPEVVLIDTRNHFEVKMGQFEGAIDPMTTIFSEFPKFVQEHLDPAKHKKVAMYCTGGIRCEKASSYMKAQGFENVYHLKGGILKYLEEIPAEQTKWQGSCFVFDRRVALTHGLEETGDAPVTSDARARAGRPNW
ncbi:MAG TPA: rhodanese-related sulfurtransferase [Micavibrio sp.]